MIGSADFDFLRRLLKERSGLALTDDKQYLLNTRLKPLLDNHGLKSIAELVKIIKNGRDDDLAEKVIDAMTTNESLFFRDSKPFQALVEHMLPTLMATRPRTKPIRIWCAAASTGQEPYSIAITLEENIARLGNLRVEIVATDLSQAALRRARMGEYTAFEVGRGMPREYLQRYFRPGERNHHIVSQKIRSRVRFETRNLLQPFSGMGSFDIVFCRNVLIYFDRATKKSVLERIAKLMPDDGFLVLGGPETTLGLTTLFTRDPDWRNVYVRTPKSESATSALASQRLVA
ncbi:MAG: protein-glutamate O-methyltransferase CheR [Devosia sp.]